MTSVALVRLAYPRIRSRLIRPSPIAYARVDRIHKHCILPDTDSGISEGVQAVTGVRTGIYLYIFEK